MREKQLLDEHEIGSIYRATYQQLCLVAMNRGVEVEIAQDIVQDFFINYWERRTQGVEAPDNFLGYASRAVRNLTISFLRRQLVENRWNAEIPALEEEFDPYEEQEQLDAYHSRLKRIFELIEELPEEQRTILKLHALDKLSYAQIAQKQGVSINTVRTQLTRAYTKLRKSASGLILLSSVRVRYRFGPARKGASPVSVTWRSGSKRMVYWLFPKVG